ncbi:MAG: glycosyltransferase [Thermoplasmata archaeon]|nr:glycosyltransferase [Candidatus Sysuiplasma jiujiangense]MBX8642871.1 glycosyltransferase [Candidatus Sysuiplasma jiujiangense]
MEEYVTVNGVGAVQNRFSEFCESTESPNMFAAFDSFKSKPAGISLVIPAYNEADRIGNALDAYLQVLQSIGLPYEVNVIMDGTDNTPEIVARYSERGVLGYRHSAKLGKGGAIIEGLKKASYNVTGYVDADGSLSPESLKTMLRYVNDYDCVVGSRWIDGSRWNREEPVPNRIASRLFNVLVRGLLGLPLRDTQCGAKLFRTEIVGELLSKTVVTNRTFDIAILYHAWRGGKRIVEVPVTWTHDDRTRMPILRVIPIMFVTLVGVRLMNLPVRKYIPRIVIDFFIRKYASD